VVDAPAPEVRMDSALVSVGLPIALAIIIFGLGLSLTPADFTRIGRQPKAVVVILLVQVVLLPIVAFALAKGFGLEPGLAVGLMILAASPGGTTANLFSHLFRGDVALNITLTAINSLLALLTLSIVVNLALSQFRAGQPSVGMQASKLLQVFAVVLVPVAIGMLVRAKAPGFADRMDKPVRIASAVLLFLVVIGAILGEEHAMAYIARVGLVTSLFCLLSLTIGYAVPRLVGLNVAQSIASGFEIGIHNSTLAIAVALTVLSNIEMAVPSAVYGIVMFLIAAIFGFVLVRLVRQPEAASTSA
jgi:BASS family bile acid:Na+ symporter